MTSVVTLDLEIRERDQRLAAHKPGVDPAFHIAPEHLRLWETFRQLRPRDAAVTTALVVPFHDDVRGESKHGGVDSPAETSARMGCGTGSLCAIKK